MSEARVDLRVRISKAVEGTALNDDVVEKMILPYVEELQAQTTSDGGQLLEVIRARSSTHGATVLYSSRLANVRFNIKSCLLHLAPAVSVEAIVYGAIDDPTRKALLSVVLLLEALLAFRHVRDVELNEDEARILLTLAAWDREGKIPTIDDLQALLRPTLSAERIVTCTKSLEALGCVRLPLQEWAGKAVQLVVLNEAIAYTSPPQRS